MMVLDHGQAVIERARAARIEAHDLCARAAISWDSARATRVRVRRLIRGGSDNGAGHIRAHLRDLIEIGQLPKRPPAAVWAGAPFAPGEVEYEFVAPPLHMHVRCVELWGDIENGNPPRDSA